MIAEIENNLFANSLIGATIQDGGKRECHITLNSNPKYNQRKEKEKENIKWERN